MQSGCKMHVGRLNTNMKEEQQQQKEETSMSM